jgi:hypothetical protein
VITHFISSSSINDKVNDLWKTENEGVLADKESRSETDKSVIKLWDANAKLIQGRYVLPVPWESEAQFPNNVSSAFPG